MYDNLNKAWTQGLEMNYSKQSGRISKFMLMLIIGGIAYGAYTANKKGLISKKTITSSVSSIKSSISSSPSNDDYVGYGVQLMATKQLDMAKELMNDFANDGYSAFVLASNSGKGRTYYKVRLGPYAHRSEALAIRDKVVQRYPKSPYVKSSLVIYKPE